MLMYTAVVKQADGSWSVVGDAGVSGGAWAKNYLYSSYDYASSRVAEWNRRGKAKYRVLLIGDLHEMES